MGLRPRPQTKYCIPQSHDHGFLWDTPRWRSAYSKTPYSYYIDPNLVEFCEIRSTPIKLMNYEISNDKYKGSRNKLNFMLQVVQLPQMKNQMQDKQTKLALWLL